MDSLALRLVLAPTLIAIASLAGRRWGPTISGWLVALPLTSGPISFLLALAYGPAFAATAAHSTIAGTLSLLVYCLAYAWTATRAPWPFAVAAGALVFGGATLALEHLTLPLPLLVVCVVGALVATLLLLPKTTRDAAPTPRRATPRWDLPARMIVAAVFVGLMTGAATVLGPQLTGLIAPFPIYVTILAAFAHHQNGWQAAVGVQRGLLYGLLGFVGFFLVISTLLEPLGIGATFTIAILVSLLSQAISLWLLRRRARALATA